MKGTMYGALAAVIMLVSCKKSEVASSPLASLNLVNASVNLGAVKTNIISPGSSNYWAGISGTTAYGAYTLYSIPANTSIPMAIATTDTTKPVFTTNLNLTDAGIYSMYLAGQSGSLDTVLMRDNIPAYYPDSSIGVRFINLSYNSVPLKITLQATPGTTEFTNLTYKQVTDIKKYPVKRTIPVGTVNWQVRNAATNDSLTMYTLPASGTISIASSRNRVITVVIKGLQGTTSGTNAFSVFPVANY